MTNYLSLFKSEQKIIFDLGNLVNNIYTAAYNVTLTASFFTADDSVVPADLILPVSGRQASQDQASVFMVPPQVASNSLTLPQNVKKAVFTIAATGQSEEEFWWSNVLQSDIDTFPHYGELYGFSPFREVQLLIDGMLAGVAWPFPVIFTGGVVPGLWRPIVGIDAFDLKEDEIDITPWLPLLCDGKAHDFEIQVSGLNNTSNGTATLSQTTDSYWWLTGKVFIWLDADGHITTGDGPHVATPTPELDVSSSVIAKTNGTNETLLYQVSAHRTLSFQSTINLSSRIENVWWKQDLSFTNIGNYSDRANIEVNTQMTQGYDASSSGYSKQYSYPLYAYSAVTTLGDNYTIFAIVNRGKDVRTLGQPVFPTGLESFSAAKAIHPHYARFEGAWLSTTQNGTATYLANETAKTSFSFGMTEQSLTFSGIEDAAGGATSEELFRRYVKAVNDTVVEDNEILVDTPIGHQFVAQPGDGGGFGIMKPPGRGGNWRGMGGHYHGRELSV